MRWSSSLADEWRRYLAQQAELGGPEVFVDRPPSVSTPDRPGTAASAEAAGPPSEPRPNPGALDAPSIRHDHSTEAGTVRGGSRTRQFGAAEESAAAAADPAPAAPLVTEPTAVDAAGTAKWKKGAPPIPGPGMTVLSPTPVLLGNDLGALDSLEAVAERIRTTYCCELCPHRTRAVPGEGNPEAKLVLVGEGPGANEDATGRPFVGAAGRLLDTILDAIEVPRPSVYITNIVKCRPPQNRKPLPDEIAACIPYLYRQLDLIAPKVIMAMGGTAGEALLGVRKSLGDLRGKVHTFNGIPLVVTYHPAALLRNPNWKKPTWDDVRIARQLLDR
jgi:uracil-DNA glycosylase family 4